MANTIRTIPSVPQVTMSDTLENAFNSLLEDKTLTKEQYTSVQSLRTQLQRITFRQHMAEERIEQYYSLQQQFASDAKAYLNEQLSALTTATASDDADADTPPLTILSEMSTDTEHSDRAMHAASIIAWVQNAQTAVANATDDTTD